MIDIGANLTHDSFDDDRDAVIERAVAAGVTHLVVTGSDAASSRAAMDLARADPGRLMATAGLHPHHASDWSPAMAELIETAAAAGTIGAVGETGLDFYRNRAPQAAQIAAFEAQLAIARAHARPVFLHQREAHAAFVAVLKNYIQDLPAAVVHCFTDTGPALADYLALGCHIGITGWVCDERRGQGVAELLERIPDDRLMLETDCPYLLPRTLAPRPASRRNESAYLAEVARVVARGRGQTTSYVDRVTTANARAFFGLEPA